MFRTPIPQSSQPEGKTIFCSPANAKQNKPVPTKHSRTFKLNGEYSHLSKLDHLPLGNLWLSILVQYQRQTPDKTKKNLESRNET